MRRIDLILALLHGEEEIEAQRLKALCFLAEKEIEIDREPALPEPLVPEERDS